MKIYSILTYDKYDRDFYLNKSFVSEEKAHKYAKKKLKKLKKKFNTAFGYVLLTSKLI